MAGREGTSGCPDALRINAAFEVPSEVSRCQRLAPYCAIRSAPWPTEWIEASLPVANVRVTRSRRKRSVARERLERQLSVNNASGRCSAFCEVQFVLRLLQANLNSQ